MDIKNRTDLARYFNKLGFKIGAEIGVDTGIYSEILCKEIPGLKLYGIDVWELNAVNSRERRLNKYKEAQKRLLPYDVTLIKKLSLDAVNDFDNNSLDFVYIDACHFFDDVMQDIINWTKRVRKGGIVAGHDYNPNVSRPVVEIAVKAYVQCHGYGLNITTDSSEALSWWFHKRWNS